MYIREAHAADSKRPAPVPDGETINTPRSMAQRTVIANRCCKKLKIDMPCLVDDMSDSTDKAYSAWPDRVFLVDVDGKIAVRADRGPWGFSPAVRQVSTWLAEKFPNVKGGGDATQPTGGGS